VDLNNTGAPASLIEEANRAMTDRDGVLVSGTHERVTGPAGRAQSFRASQFYLKSGSKSGSMKPCIKTGCSGQVCSDQEVVTTCEYRSEYDCYKEAECKRQANGECGFTQTRELRACLNRRRP
jgi:eight-cysteine-cluster-containing protein